MFLQASAREPNLKAYQFRDFPQPPVRTMSERFVVDNRDGDAADHCRRIKNGLRRGGNSRLALAMKGKLVDDEGTAIIAASR